MKYFKTIINFFTKLFLRHPNRIGEGYFEHMLNALTISILSLLAFFIFFVHSIFPFIFEKTGCSIILYIADKCNRAANNYRSGDF
tara:strand:- start:3274 stop:3528 length:255 start_codon:yes stop_codon:yes gene_type:complete